MAIAFSVGNDSFFSNEGLFYKNDQLCSEAEFKEADRQNWDDMLDDMDLADKFAKESLAEMRRLSGRIRRLKAACMRRKNIYFSCAAKKRIAQLNAKYDDASYAYDVNCEQ